MTLIIETPDTRAPERDYVFSVILSDFLGLDWQHVPIRRTDTRITLKGHTGEIRMPDTLLQIPDKDWLEPCSLPVQPLGEWDISEFGLPINLISSSLPLIYGDGSNASHSLRHSTPNIRYLKMDIFSSAFFMLTRYEESVKKDRDEHGRFPAKSSLAFQEGFLERPIIDEYVELLWAAMNNFWPSLTRKVQRYSVLPTHDLDRPFLFSSVKNYCRGLLSHLRHGSFLIAQEWLRYGKQRLSGAQNDPFIKGLYFLLDVSEKYNLKSCLNIMGARPGKKDSGYNAANPIVCKLISDTLQRGHEIGFHAGYETCHDERLFQEEKERVEQNYGITLQQGRQHYLCANFPETWRIWDKAGFVYDSSACYADISGFRCGVCRSYPVYDIENRRKLRLRERPLILMDGTLKASFNENLSEQDGLRRSLKLVNACRKFNGEFVILWHNSSLHFEWKSWRMIYEECLKKAVEAK